MEIADILNANLKASLKLTLDSGAILICRFDDVDTRDHDNAFAKIESVIDGRDRPHLAPGARLKFFFSEITRVEKDGQTLYEHGPVRIGPAIMTYHLQELLDLFHTGGAVALYLSDNYPPVLAISDAPLRDSFPGGTYPSANLFPIDGPALGLDDLRNLIAEIKAYSTGFAATYPGLEELRYHHGTDDFDVFLFVTDTRILIEFRRPDK